MFLHDITETVFASSSSTTYHHHGVLFNGNMLVCNDSNISACVKECARQYAPIDQQACVTAVEAKFAPYSNCFTGEATVIVRGTKSRVRLRDLQTGDWVLDSGMKFSPVVGWLHRDLEATANVITLFHENGSICCTADHLLYCCDASDYVPATKAKTLEILYLDGSMTKSRVVKMAERTRTGIYAPLTASGSLLVNGVNASCYASPTALPFRVTQPVGQIALWPFRLGINSNNFLDVYCRTLYSLLAY
jgi:hypothetical protein